jgi:hypothetical protein
MAMARAGPRRGQSPGNPRTHRSDGGSSASGGRDEPDDDDDDDENWAPRVPAGWAKDTQSPQIDRPEFYMRGRKAIDFWAANGIGTNPMLAELFKIYFTKYITGRLSGGDAAQASASMPMLLLACRDRASGRLPSDTARAISDTVVYLTTKAGYGSYKATVVRDLYGQDLLDPDFRRRIRVATTVVNGDERRTREGRAGGALDPAVERMMTRPNSRSASRQREGGRRHTSPVTRVARASQYAPQRQQRQQTQQQPQQPQHQPQQQPGGRGRGGGRGGGGRSGGRSNS